MGVIAILLSVLAGLVVSVVFVRDALGSPAKAARGETMVGTVLSLQRGEDGDGAHEDEGDDEESHGAFLS